MHWAEAVLLGIVEGLTEFLPISSTGHLVLADAFLHHDDDASKAFEVVIQSGAILAVIIHYRRVFMDLLAGLVRRDPQKVRLAIALVLAVIPVAAIGLVFDKKIKALLFGPLPIAGALITGGVVMIAVELYRRAKNIRGENGLERVTLPRAIAIALAQCVSLWPGSSRSMTTIVGGQLAGLDTPTAAEFTFLLSVPVLGGATLVHLVKDRDALLGPSIGLPNMLIGLATAFVVAMLAIRGFLKYLTRFGLVPFGVYRILVGVAVLILVGAGILR
ncbi:MAG: undecaprenyl-diphosphate phosphatase [Polyangiaceae bacterium]